MTSAWGVSWQRWWGYSWGSFDEKIGGDDGSLARRRKKRKQREFEDERRERDELRRFIQRALEPVKESAEVMVLGDAVAVMPRRGPDVALPVPPSFTAGEVSDAVMSVLRDNAVRAERVRTAEARERAKAEVRRMMEQIRRRRNDEWLLLLS